MAGAYPPISEPMMIQLVPFGAVFGLLGNKEGLNRQAVVSVSKCKVWLSDEFVENTQHFPHHRH